MKAITCSWLMALVCLGAADARSGEIEDACRALVMGYAVHRDQHNPDEFAALFTENAVLDVLGERFEGRQALKQRMLDARGGQWSVHLMSTILITPTSDKSAHGTSYVTVYMGEPGDSPVPLTTPSGVGEYHDRFVLTDEGWKIAERRFVPRLMAAQPE